MTTFMKWGILTRVVAFSGVLLAIGSQWFEPIASSNYSVFALLIGFALAFGGVSAARGIFVFRKTYSRLRQEELQRLERL